MKILYISDWVGKRYDIYTLYPVSSNNAISELKIMMYEQTGIFPNQQELKLDEQTLEDQFSLNSYAINESDLITLEILDKPNDPEIYPEIEIGFEESVLVSNSKQQREIWECLMCTFHNDVSSDRCQMCLTERGKRKRQVEELDQPQKKRKIE